jgi:hypothetical protein
MTDKTQEMVRVPQAGELAREEFGANSIEKRGELADRALAKQAEAQVQARYLMAMKNPRDMMEARERLLRDCSRPVFARKAIYKKPVGKGVEGPSIRLAEAAARAMTNIITDVMAVYDDTQKRIIRVMASDLEANITFTKDVTVHKAVERSNATGRKVISSRTNSNGQLTYLVEATDDEIADRENALASKAIRGCLLRLTPGDILEEAIQRCYETMLKKDAEDPDGARKEMCDAFADIGVTVEQIASYLGHPLDQTVEPKEMKDLRGIYNAIKDGEATWSEALAARAPSQQKPGEGKTPAPDTKPATLADAAAKSKASREKAPEAAPEKQPVVKLEGTDGKQMELGRTPGEEG